MLNSSKLLLSILLLCVLSLNTYSQFSVGTSVGWSLTDYNIQVNYPESYMYPRLMYSGDFEKGRYFNGGVFAEYRIVKYFSIRLGIYQDTRGFYFESSLKNIYFEIAESKIRYLEIPVSILFSANIQASRIYAILSFHPGWAIDQNTVYFNRTGVSGNQPLYSKQYSEEFSNNISMAFSFGGGLEIKIWKNLSGLIQVSYKFLLTNDYKKMSFENTWSSYLPIQTLDVNYETNMRSFVYQFGLIYHLKKE